MDSVKDIIKGIYERKKKFNPCYDNVDDLINNHEDLFELIWAYCDSNNLCYKCLEKRIPRDNDEELDENYDKAGNHLCKSLYTLY